MNSGNEKILVFVDKRLNDFEIKAERKYLRKGYG